MGFIDDKPGDKRGDKPPEGKGEERRGAARDGVRRDAHGNAIWQWAIDTGKHAIDSTSRLLKRLEVPGLRLEDDPGPKTKEGSTAKRDPAGAGGGGAGGYDPYGGRLGAKTPPARPPARPAAAVRKPVAAPPARPSLWRRLFRRG